MQQQQTRTRLTEGGYFPTEREAVTAAQRFVAATGKPRVVFAAMVRTDSGARRVEYHSLAAGPASEACSDERVRRVG